MKRLLSVLLVLAIWGGVSAAEPPLELVAWRGETVFCVVTFTNTLEKSCEVVPLWGLPGRPTDAPGRYLRGACHAGFLRPVPWNAKGETVLDLIGTESVTLPPGGGIAAAGGVEVPRNLSSGGGITAVGWIEVPRSLPPGAYDFTFGLWTAGAQGGPVLFPRPVRLTVQDRTLPAPADRKTYLDLWQHPWAVARMAKAAPFSKAHYDAMRPLWRNLAAAGQKVLTTTIVGLPWNHQCYDGYGTMIRHIRKADGTWRFDYSIFDAYVAFGRDCGIGPDIACYTMCPWGNVVRWEDEKGNEQKVAAPAGSKEFADYWGPFLKDFAAHLKAKGWYDHAYIAMDERSPQEVKAIADFVQTRAPGLKISMAGNRSPRDFKGITIDNYSQAIQHVTPAFLAEAKARHAEGRITTYYVCCAPRRPNTFMASDPDEAFWLGFYPAAAGLDGFLRWAYNSWPEDPAKNAAFGNWPAGDTFLVYPQGLSMRWLRLCEGLAQGEKLRLLREQGAATPELEAIAREYDAGKVPSGAALADLVHRTRAALNAPSGAGGRPAASR